MADDPNLGTQVVRAYSSRVDVLRVIRSPLSFFVLALLVIEVFLLIAGATFDLPLEVRIGVLIGGVLLFVLIIACVYRLVVKYPTHLVFSETSHVEAMRYWGNRSNELPRGALDIIPGVPQPELPKKQTPSLTDGA